MDSPFEPSSRDGDAEAEDTYQTPNDDVGNAPDHAPDGETSTASASAWKKDQDVVTEAGRSIRNLLKEMLDNLKPQSDATIKLSGEFKLTIGDRQSYALAISDASTADESRLIIKINPLDAPATTTGASTVSKGKRYMDYAGEVDTTTPSAKRQKQNGQQSTPDLAAAATAQANAALAVNPEDGEHPTAPDEEDDDPSAPFDLEKEIRQLTKQIKWVETCRRTASSEYHQREERWRTTSATFHDQNRVKRERHEAWVAAEMARQTNMLGQVINDVKGLYPLLHSVKWETPTAAPHPLYATSVTAPAPHFTTADTQMNQMRTGNGHGQGNPPGGRGATRGRPRGRPRGSS
ncbi:hypothetical protein NA57DRAFT_75583 [Rhizodiscina lignyota]|uniref:Uncharacterized protein n=1 Tax=Rhizodiscina lignyota TaxID=1504668 RepID=A0A9P4IL02_9PEZI|nr:hypothetical protein NA57DRAFT_75583 [Rhizodiscina lignyota]